MYCPVFIIASVCVFALNLKIQKELGRKYFREFLEKFVFAENKKKISGPIFDNRKIYFHENTKKIFSTQP